MKRHISTFILIVVFLIGLSLLLYPTISDYWNSFHASKVIADYSQTVADMDENTYDLLWAAAEEYNRKMAGQRGQYYLNGEQMAEYNSLLNVGGTGIMGYVEIDTLGIAFPIYHGTSESVLQIAVGHLEWSSLPVGGAGSHCVISGHRGLPSARLFTDLDKMVEGDTFVIRTLDEVLTYEVDQILIVEPHQTEALQIVEGEDLCTLFTCTPYGVNTHRLLVRGHRVENAVAAKLIRVTSDATTIDPIIVAPVMALPLLIIMLIWLMKPKKHKKKGNVQKERKSYSNFRVSPSQPDIYQLQPQEPPPDEEETDQTE